MTAPVGVDPAAPLEVSSAGLLARAARGAAALGVRQVAVTGLNVLGAAALARLVEPAVFGVFAVASFVVGFLNFFAEAGLGASLIRQPQEPNRAELNGAFTMQLALAGAIATVAWFLAPALAGAIHAVPDTVLLLRLALLSLVVAAFNLVPGALLERDLQFGRLGAVNVCQAIVFNGVAIVAAATGHPVVGVGMAMVAQAVVGALLLALAHHWRPALEFRPPGLRQRLAFSIPLQASSILSSIKDAIAPLFVGSLLGARRVGLVEWANSFAAYPVLALMAFQQVYLPTFARVQNDRAALGRVANNVLLGTNLIVAPLAAITFALARPITTIVFGDKWLVALPTYRLFWIANLFVASASPLFSLLYARGRSRAGLGLTVLWMLVTWVLGVPLIHAFGIIGYGIANVGVQLTNLLLFRLARQEADVRIWPQFWRPWTVAAAAAFAVYLLSQLLPTGVPALVGEIIVGLTMYAVFMWRVEQRLIRRVLTAVRTGR